MQRRTLRRSPMYRRKVDHSPEHLDRVKRRKHLGEALHPLLAVLHVLTAPQRHFAHIGKVHLAVHNPDASRSAVGFVVLDKAEVDVEMLDRVARPGREAEDA